MTTSQTPSILSEINGEQAIPLKTRQYFRRLLQDRIHELVLQAFIDQEKREGLTQKQLAGRLEKDQAQISRWLLTAGNWEFDTLADLLLGMGMRLNELSVTRFLDLILAEQKQREAAQKKDASPWGDRAKSQTLEERDKQFPSYPHFGGAGASAL